MAQASNLSRYQPAVLSVAGIAAVCGIYTLYTVYAGGHSTSALKRSNAVHRPRRERHAGGTLIERMPASPDAPLGLILLRQGDDSYVVNLATMFPTIEELQYICQPPIQEARQRIAVQALELILVSCFDAASNALDEPERWERLADIGLTDLVSAMAARDAGQVLIQGRRIAEILRMDGIGDQQVLEAVNNFMLSERWTGAVNEIDELDPPETEDMDATDIGNKEPSHGLRGLLYYIAEEDAKRKAYEHRGIRCEECAEMPIRGVRYHCLNCPDYDLCASCEQNIEHIKTHVFAKIKIPLPVLSQPTKEYRVWYPGDPQKRHESIESALRKRMCHEHGYEEPDVDALYDQFLANANVPFPNAKTTVKAAIDRRAFNKALSRETWETSCTGNAMYDRMFAFYDTDRNGMIDFEEFMSGVAYLRGPKRFATLGRAIRGYDMDGDTFVDRADFARLLRAKYEIQRQLVSDMVDGQETETTQVASEILQSSQPISSVFSQEDIPPGEHRPIRGKIIDSRGDMQPTNGTKTILDHTDPWPRNVFSRATVTRQNISRFEEMLYAPFDGSPPASPLSGDDMEQMDGLRTSQNDQYPTNGEREVITIDPDLLDEDAMQPPVDDIIWQTAENGLNELLDKIFKAKEIEDAAVETTSASREKWADQIAAAREEEKRERKELIEGAKTDPLVEAALNAGLNSNRDSPSPQNGERPLRRQMVPTDRASLQRREQEISDASLEELLDSSGFGVRDSARITTSPRAAHIGASSIWNGVRRNEATSPLRLVISSEEEEYVDPTLPQHRPNAAPVVAITPPPLTNGSKRTPPELPERAPAKDHLLYLARLNDAERLMEAKGGPGRLSYDEIEAIAVADKSGELRGLVKSWLEYASF